MKNTLSTQSQTGRTALGQTLKDLSQKGLKGSLWAACAAFTWTLAVPTQAQQYMQQTEGTRIASRAGVTAQIEDLGDLFEQSTPYVDRKQSRLVFYRPRVAAGEGMNDEQESAAKRGAVRNGARALGAQARRSAKSEAESMAKEPGVEFTLDAKQPGAASVYINGDYQTSLVPGGYSQVCLNPGQAQVSVRQRDVSRRSAADRMDTISEIGMEAGNTQYIKVQEGQGRAMVLMPVSAQQALNELQGARLQMHTISRVKGQSECRMVAQAAPVAAPVAVKTSTESFTLAGDTLFKFDRSDRAGLMDQGVQALDTLMQNIRRSYKSVDNVHLIGYTDPLGSAVYNQRLSQQRAETVSDYMQSSNPALRGHITTEGRGSKDLVATGCGNSQSAQTQACNRANRRVVIQVTGVRN